MSREGTVLKNRPDKMRQKRGRADHRADLWLFVGSALFAGLSFWLLDSAVDAAVFGEGTFLRQVFHPDKSELWMRSFVSVLLLGGGVWGWGVFRQRLTASRQIDLHVTELDHLYQSAPVGVMVLDGEMLCARVNDVLARKLGYEADDLAGRDLRETALDVACVLEETVQQVVASGEPSPGIEFHCLKNDPGGGERHWAVRCYPLSLKDGSPAASCMFTDLSDARLAERARRESDQRFREMTDLMPQTLFEIDREGNVLYTNRHGLLAFGYTAKDLEAGIRISSLFVEEDLPRLERDLGQGNREFGAAKREYMARRKGGGFFPAYVNTSAIVADGKPVGYRGVVLDMTDLKHTEEALRESEEQLRLTINALGDAMFVVDMDFKIVLYNDPFLAWNRSLGIEAGAIGVAVTDLYPFLPDSVLDEYRHVFTTGETLITEEESLVEERLITTESRKIPVWEGGGVVRVITVIRDVTERKRAEGELKKHGDYMEEMVQERTEKLGRANYQLRKEIGDRRRAQQEVLRLNEELEQRIKERTAELEKAYDELKDLDKMKDVFLSTISHEFRTPLTSIRSYSEVLLTYDEKVTTQKDFLQIINSESERLSRLIDNVLDLSQIEAGGMVWNDELMSVEEVVQRVARTEGQILETEKIGLELEFGSDVKPVFADFDRIQQVITNLLGNAIKFSPAGGAISIRADSLTGRRSGETCEWVRVCVADCGEGIDEKDQTAIFERFRQVSSNTLTNKPKGTGLGLPICREIVAHYGGNLWVESKAGHGSAFYFTLPCAEEPQLARESVLLTEGNQGAAPDAVHPDIRMERSTPGATIID